MCVRACVCVYVFACVSECVRECVCVCGCVCVLAWVWGSGMTCSDGGAIAACLQRFPDACRHTLVEAMGSVGQGAGAPTHSMSLSLLGIFPPHFESLPPLLIHNDQQSE